MTVNINAESTLEKPFKEIRVMKHETVGNKSLLSRDREVRGVSLNILPLFKKVRLRWCYV